ncbi:MAG: ChbG/HpnK family deacetylase [Steroidobacteraceae bacterium]
MTPLILSADDFGMDAGIDAAVIDLALRGRLTATSCLTLSPRWQEAARSLTPDVRDRIDVGLHLDFTEFDAAMSWSTLVIASCARGLRAEDVSRRIAVQLDAFEAATGAQPDYVDGHRHVHQLPQIRTALLNELTRRYGRSRPWIRLSRPAPGSGFKGSVIDALGGRELQGEAEQAGFRCTARLLGVYGFDLSASDYAHEVTSWLGQARRFDALMVHVARDAPATDPIGKARVAEYAAFCDDAFAAALSEAGVQLARGREVFAA